MTARKIGLLLLILLGGGIVDAAWFVRHEMGLGASGCRAVHGRFSGPSHTFTSEQSRPLGAAGRVEVTNAFGDVRVTAADGNDLRATLRTVVYHPDAARAEAFAGGVRLLVDGATATAAPGPGPASTAEPPSPVAAASTPAAPAAPAAPATPASPAEAGTVPVRITTTREEMDRGRPEIGFETHLELSVPPGTSVVVRNQHGRVDVAGVAAVEVTASSDDVTVERIAGPAQVRARHGEVRVAGVTGTLWLASRHGNVEVRDVEGASTLEVEHGEASLERVGPVSIRAAHVDVRLETVAGDLDVTGQHAGITAADVRGNARIETSYRAVEVRRVGGEARIKTVHASVEASDVEGPLTAEGSYDDIELSRIAGPVDVRVAHGGVRAEGLARGGRVSASGRDVVLQGFTGAMEVQAERANVELHPTGALAETLVARTTFGDITLYVPDGSRMALEAATPRGAISVDVPGLAVTREGQRATGTLGAGTNPVRLFADHGDVRVSAGTALAADGDGEEDEKEDRGRD